MANKCYCNQLVQYYIVHHIVSRQSSWKQDKDKLYLNRKMCAYSTSKLCFSSVRFLHCRRSTAQICLCVFCFRLIRPLVCIGVLHMTENIDAKFTDPMPSYTISTISVVFSVFTYYNVIYLSFNAIGAMFFFLLASLLHCSTTFHLCLILFLFRSILFWIYLHKSYVILLNHR